MRHFTHSSCPPLEAKYNALRPFLFVLSISTPHFASEEELNKWAHHVSLALTELRKFLHANNLLQKRTDLNEHSTKIEKARLTSADSKIFYNYITDSVHAPPATELLIEGTWVDTDKDEVTYRK